ncbi:MAG: SGNH/GDSL hydrolase family protein, partial [Actinobacteria bacterium]|nr:SGNH/GDSL hydrolase family protein [Actinomycetota bacterium]NIW28453.1 SGNH/GDSL hydrolase family protein [Actinomycetota bacterium]
SVDEDERWPVRLARALEESGWSTVDVEIIARTGWTTAELDRGIDAADPQGPFDLVTILIGVNDQFRGRSADAYGEELAAMIERAQGFSTGPVLMVSIPDWGTTPYGEGYSPKVIARDIDEYNAVGTEVSAAAGIPFVDITPISRSGDPDLVSYDDLHPSGSQYAAWVEEILPVAIDLLEG